MSKKSEEEDKLAFPISWYIFSFIILLIGGVATVLTVKYTSISSLQICNSIDVGKSWKSLGTYLTRAAAAAMILASFADSCLTIACKPCKRKLNIQEKNFDSEYAFIKNPKAKEVLLQKIRDNKNNLDANIAILPENIWVPCIIYTGVSIFALATGLDQLLGIFTLAFYTPAFWLYWKVSTFCNAVEVAIKQKAKKYKEAEDTLKELETET